METEQGKVLEGLQHAIQMETDGKEYYLKTSQQTHNEPGKKLLQSLAAEEDNHLRTIVQIYDTIKNRKGWPDTHFQPDAGRWLRTVFMKALEAGSTAVKSPAGELRAVETAMDMENKTLDFYAGQSKQAVFKEEKEFYELLAGEEREHHLILLDYYEYLKNPAGWFVNKERHSLDGGS